MRLSQTLNKPIDIRISAPFAVRRLENGKLLKGDGQVREAWDLRKRRRSSPANLCLPLSLHS